ncbi:MAG: hypothetical protein K2Q12_11490 [Rickettsiales bacterium]|nr:hypothetical protein [Rickettsiales bacterium]
MPITSRADFDRIITERDQRIQAISDQAARERWNEESAINEMAEVELPYYRTLSDPANIIATGFATEDFVSDPTNEARLAVPNDHELIELVSKITSQLNAEYGQAYVPPRIIFTRGYIDPHARFSFSQEMDAVLIDMDHLATIHDSEMLTGCMGHELTHRYQRSDLNLLAKLILNYNEYDPVALRTVRVSEAEADYRGAQVSSPAAMQRALRDLYIGLVNNTPEADAVEYLRLQKPGLSLERARHRFSMMPEKHQDLLICKTSGLPKEIQNKLRNMVMVDLKALEAAGESVSDHPSIEHRERMLKLLQDNPDLLNRPGVHFDDSANIIIGTKGSSPLESKIKTPPRRACASNGKCVEN